ncbi:MAG: bifunctional phosphoribosylaminoimidazolecarboxamide formyltransferase/IMP cyclohydrolase, partial [Desulfuromonadaceae bacterium]|nr:bifunctional phosphoribosylaminoimidazolecarboxamide formyltransferase/IMP cyclohydrolase [Desulfuromonadaceae bacterium]
ENPHQAAAFYIEENISQPCVSNAVQLQGKELSFNNIIDLDAAIETVKEFEKSAAVIIKHTNPCGVALADSPLTAYLKARECDPVSSFGGIVGFNRIVDAETANELTSTFLEAVIAPGYSEEALAIFTAKKNVRVMQMPRFENYVAGGYDMKRVTGGLLLQGCDLGMVNAADCRIVTERKPTASEYEALDFAWRVCKHVKSNAIVFSNRDQTVGIGAGQMSRVDSSKIAVQKALLPIRGTVLASDAFFPFRDGVDAAAEAGVTAIIQTGGSVRDEEVIKAANEHGIAMVFTTMRHFRH